jgi:hypothetical protein
MVAGWNPVFFSLKHRFHILHFPDSTDFSQNQPAAIEVEGAKTNTPSKTNTYKRLPITNTLLLWTVPGGVGVCMGPQSDCLRCY